MFLNWVYRSPVQPPFSDACAHPHPGTWPGFLNASWVDLTSPNGNPIIPVSGGDADDDSNPGSKRFAWMFNSMTLIFSGHG
jgi:hypothetical protein